MKIPKSARDALTRAFINRTRATAGKRVLCENCGDTVVFALRDAGGREFSVGLYTLLECLSFAQRRGSLPKFPDDWWEWWSDVCCGYML